MKNKLAAAIPLLLVAGLCGWLIWSHSTALEGSFEARGTLGSWTMSPDTCEAGGRRGFHGVTLWASGSPERTLRLVSEPSGAQVVTIFEEDGRVQVPLDDCEEASLILEQTSTRSPDGVHNMRGSVELDCPTLSGHATFEHCKPDV